MSDTDEDGIVVHDAAGRRRFIRAGAAFVATGVAAVATGRAALAADCDRNAEGCGCSDSDSGEGSDPTGAGKRCSTISISTRTVEVDKVRG